MNRAGRSGFMLLYVLVVIALVGGAVYLLTDACGTMAFETREMYVEACGRNLSASGVAWARHAKARAGSEDIPARSLDASALAIPNADLRVAIRGAEAAVSASCRRGRRLLRRRETHRLE